MGASLETRSMTIRACLLACALFLFASSVGSAQEVLFREDGEGLADGEPVPGWTVCDGACANVTATTSVKKVGNVGIRVNGDNLRHKPLEATLTGRLEVSLWMFPATDSNTNNSFRLSTPLTREIVIIRINESNTWFLSTPAGTWVLGPYKMDWTKVRLVLDPVQETVDAYLDNVQVGFGISTMGPDRTRYLSQGISMVGMHSGRGGAGHDSFFDDLVITSGALQPPVVLVHGWCGSRESFGSMGPLLFSDLNPLLVENFTYNGRESPAGVIEDFDRRDLKRLSAHLARYIETIITAARMSDPSVSQVDVVAHSMGGLLARAWMAGLAVDSNLQPVPYSGEIRRLILAGTPNFGHGWPFGLPDCSEANDTVRQGQREQMEFGSEFLKELNEKWEAELGKNIFPESILTIVGCGFILTGHPCVDDLVVDAASATLPVPKNQPDYQVRYVNRVHFYSLVDIDNGDHPTYRLVSGFLQTGSAEPVLEPGAVEPLVVVRLLENSATFAPFSELQVVKATDGSTRTDFSPNKISSDPTGWWPFATGIPENCCAGFWTVTLSNGRQFFDIIYPAPGLEVRATPGRPFITSPVEVRPKTHAKRPDLEVTDVVAPDGTVLSFFEVNATVTNRGEARAKSSKIAYYLSPDAVRGSADVRLFAVDDVPSLKPGTWHASTTTVFVPSDAVPGIYRLLVCADDGNELVESQGSNNCRASGTTFGVGVLPPEPPPGLPPPPG